MNQTLSTAKLLAIGAFICAILSLFVSTLPLLVIAVLLVSLAVFIA